MRHEPKGTGSLYLRYIQDPRLIGAFREEPGIFPGYHMNKDHWLTVALDGTVGEEKIRFLTELSHSLTKGGKRETIQEVLP